MKTYLIPAFVVLSVCGPASADIHQAPPAFPYANATAQFVDFETADYQITYDLKAKTANVQTRIRFHQAAAGHMVFDLVGPSSLAKLDGTEVEVKEVALPGDVSKMRVLGSPSSAGSHVLEIESPLKELVSFESGAVKSAFWTSDLDDRQYLEQYMPANLEYDQVAMTFHIHFVGLSKPQEVMANGTVERKSDSEFLITFPAHYTTSSIFFHTFPSGAFSIAHGTHASVDGRAIPITTYANSAGTAKAAMDRGHQILMELEADYGPWPHASLIIYGEGMGGMEYCGATMTQVAYVGHEMFHSYHARGLMPANGDAGWMDEAIAKWRDNGYQIRRTPGYAGVRMAGRSPYVRWTPMTAYDQGEKFMSYLASQAGTEASAFKKFLRTYFDKFKYTTVTTEQFRSEFEAYVGKDLDADFDTYVYGKGATGTGSGWPANAVAPVQENPIHRRLTKAQLKSLL